MAVVDSDNYCTTINDEKHYLLEVKANKTKPAEVRGRFFYYRLKWLINNKGAALVLIMVALVNIFDLRVVISTTHLSEALRNNIYLFAAYSGCSIFFYLFYPITGLYADIKFGRYKTGFAALCVSLCSSLLMILGLMLYEAKIVPIPYFSFSLYSIGYILGNFARTSFLIVILSFGVDQMVGASGEQLSAFAQWYYFCWITGWTVSVPILCLAKGSEHRLFGFYGSHVFCIVVALIIMVSLKRSGMVTEPHIKTNPVSMIVNILRYAKNNKYPRNRSALTYWENDYPSRLDLAIQKYGGPFSEEQVQDFKTLLRVLPLIICMLVFFVTEEDGYDLFLPQPSKEKFPHCLTSSVYFINGATMIITMLVHQIILYPLLYKYYPTMLQKIGIGIFLCVVAEGSFLAIDVISISSKTTTGCLLNKFSNATYHYWETHDLFIMIPKLISGLGFGTVAPTTLEFAFAQAPYSMRGVIVGVWFMAAGCLQTFGFSLKYPFKLLRDSSPSCEFYLFTTKFLIVGLSFFCFVFLSLHYRLRFRGDQYNQHQTVVKYYTKYLNHEEENGSSTVDYSLHIEDDERNMHDLSS